MVFGLRDRRSSEGRQDLKTPMQRIKDPRGRIDWLLGSLLARAVEERRSPVLNQVYAQLREPLELMLRSQLGPKNKALRPVRKYIAEGQKLLEGQNRYGTT